MGWIEKMPEDQRNIFYDLEREQLEIYLRHGVLPEGEPGRRLREIKEQTYKMFRQYGEWKPKRRIIKRARLLRRQ